jgi:cytochrome c biogenesis protein ResB
MEESAFALRFQAVFAEKGRFSALGIDADHVALITVDALRAVPERFAHCIY